MVPSNSSSGGNLGIGGDKVKARSLNKLLLVIILLLLLMNLIDKIKDAVVLVIQ